MKAENDEKSPEAEKLSAILDGLKPQYQRFVRHYCQYLSKTAAAIAAGYAESCASVTGFHIYNRPEVRTAITEYFRATEFIPEDNIAGIKRIAEIDMSQYFVEQETWVSVKKSVPIQVVIDQAVYDLKLEDMMFMDSQDFGPIEKTTILQNLKALQRRVKSLKNEQRVNPKAKKFIYVDELKREKVMDIDRVIADKVPIKSVKYKETGIELELYSSLDAKRDLARVARLVGRDDRGPGQGGRLRRRPRPDRSLRRPRPRILHRPCLRGRAPGRDPQ